MQDTTTIIFETLRNEILTLVIKPGEEISEASICKRFNASRTPVRSAFLKLEDIGLLDNRPYKPARASLLDRSIIKQQIFLRTTVEEKIIETFIKLNDKFAIADAEHILKKQKILLDSQNVAEEDFYKSDKEFHKVWFEKTENMYLWHLIQNMDVHYTRFRMLDLVGRRLFTEIYDEHLQLMSFIEKGDIENAKALINMHLQGGIRRLKSLLNSEYASYFTT